MGTVPMGTGELRRIHSRVAWMFFPVDKSITVSAPHFTDQRIFSTSSSIEEATAELPMLALTLTRKLRPMIIGSDELGRDELGDGRAERFAPVLMKERAAVVPAVLPHRVERGPAPHVLAQ